MSAPQYICVLLINIVFATINILWWKFLDMHGQVSLQNQFLKGKFLGQSICKVLPNCLPRIMPFITPTKVTWEWVFSHACQYCAESTLIIWCFNTLAPAHLGELLWCPLSLLWNDWAEATRAALPRSVFDGITWICLAPGEPWEMMENMPQSYTTQEWGSFFIFQFPIYQMDWALLSGSRTLTLLAQPAAMLPAQVEKHRHSQSSARWMLRGEVGTPTVLAGDLCQETTLYAWRRKIK